MENCIAEIDFLETIEENSRTYYAIFFNQKAVICSKFYSNKNPDVQLSFYLSLLCL